MEQYYDSPMSEAAEARCRYTARLATNDIMALVLNNDTDMDELRECLKRVANIVIHELSMVRNAKSDIAIEMEATRQLEGHAAAELQRVLHLSQTEAEKEAFAWGMDMSMAHNLYNFDQNSSPSSSSDPPKKFAPPSGRASPLLRTSNEAIALPPRPASIAETDPQDRVFSPSLPELRVVQLRNGTPGADRNKYITALKISLGGFKHRLFTLQQMENVFNDSKAPLMDRMDLQIAILYCVFYSRGVRAMFNEEKHPMRPIEWAPIRAHKVFSFSCALNYLTETFHIALADSNDNDLKVKYIARLWHMHSHNWAPNVRDDHLEDGLRRSASFCLSSSGNFALKRTHSLN